MAEWNNGDPDKNPLRSRNKTVVCVVAAEIVAAVAVAAAEATVVAGVAVAAAPVLVALEVVAIF